MRAALVVAALLLPAAARAGTLEVMVDNIRSDRGHIRVAVCTPASFLKENCEYRGIAKARAGSVLVVVADVPPGTYAAQAFQDEDDDGRIKRNLFGIPREGIGFSRDAPFRFGPPRFADAAFQLGPAGGRIVFSLRYFD